MNERQCLRANLYGENCHLHILHALEGLEPSAAGERVPGQPHSIHQILQHMIYWQDIALARLREQSPERPASAALGWEGGEAPQDEDDWVCSIAHLAEGLGAIGQMLEDESFDLDRVVDRERNTTAREEILMVQGHNAYHLGQIVQLRQGLGSWPPPRGGDTW